jgi:hypothetical protein
MFLLVIIIVAPVVGLILYESTLKNPNEKEVRATVIGFESVPNQWYPCISPILSYEVNGKKYRCVMYMLQCDDSYQNRLSYINKEYTLYYTENFPNRVRTSTIYKKNLIAYLLILFIMIMMCIMTGGM